MKLTETTIRKLKFSKDGDAQEIIWDDAMPSFGVRLRSSGRKTFVCFYRHHGRQHLRTLGVYGRDLSLEQARDKAKKHFAGLLDNMDGMGEKEKTRRGISFKDFAAEYISRYAKKHKKSWIEDQRRLDKYLLPAWGGYKLAAISRQDVARLHGEIGNQYPYAANRTLELVSKIYSLAQVWGFLPTSAANPAKGVPAYKEVKRDRWVTPDELPLLAEAINKEFNVYGKYALWLYLLLGVRRDELLRAKWDDIDWDRKEIKIAETKAGRPHYVSLSAPALKILSQIEPADDNPYIIAGERPGSHLVNIEKIWRRVRKAAKVEDVRLHDLRRTVGSWLAQSGNSLHLIGRVLNHSSQATTAVYARFGQDNVRQALEAHGQKIIDISGHLVPGSEQKGKRRRRS